MNTILEYAQRNRASFEMGGVSSNEIRFFTYEGKRYILKTPFMTRDDFSPFWTMMRRVFGYSVREQNASLYNIYSALKDNPHIKVAPIVAANEDASVFEFVEGKSWDNDFFPKGKNNAYTLGQFIGYNHRTKANYSGLLGTSKGDFFFENARRYIEDCISEHWSGNDDADKKVRGYYEQIKDNKLSSCGNSLIMIDICADQFLFSDENIVACVDLDAYVIGPVELELSFLHYQVEDWDEFKAGYETYCEMPSFDEVSKLFFLLMALNSYNNKAEIDGYWAGLLEER
ncbi:hypothetical protein [Butyrivibrio sp. AC2005]|uniref:hypothetical protein n=1 Tax=Butyrivibrio sp. AC2005 TaxID=1280672 RepID=UPI0004125DE5|nr:hypothetical protein [Butyrivibrio sp. AC2005]